MWRIIKTITQNRLLAPKILSIAYVLRVVVEIISTANPLITKAIVDTIQQGEHRIRFFYMLLVVFFLATCVDQILTKVSNAYLSIFKERFFLAKNKISFTKVFSLDYQQYIQEGTGKLLKKLERGVESERRIFESIYYISSVAFIRFASSLIVIFYTLPLAAAVLIVGILFLLALSKYTQKKSDPLYKDIKDIWEQASRQESKMIMEKQLINLSVKEQREMKTYETMLLPLQQKSWKADFWGGLPYDLVFIVFRIVEGIGYVFIARQIRRNAGTFGDVIMLIGFLWQLRWPFDLIARAIADWSKEKARYESLQDILTLEPQVKNGTDKYIPQSGHIHFDNIGFAYDPTKDVIQHFTLDIPGGTTCALVGHSGSGKSTLIKLLLRYYDVATGCITMDNQNIADIDKKSLYPHIGYLSQEPSIFDGTIRENILYGLGEDSETHMQYTDDMVWKALEKAHISSHVRTLDGGLDTEIGERGIKLSGGERQRLAIARIFLKNPSILILDEPTSALDSVSEHAITQVMKNLFAHRTVIIVAHRLQTVMHANNIVVLEKGHIVQQGTHNDLIQKEGVYKTLVDLQSGLIRE